MKGQDRTPLIEVYVHRNYSQWNIHPYRTLGSQLIPWIASRYLLAVYLLQRLLSNCCGCIRTLRPWDGFSPQILFLPPKPTLVASKQLARHLIDYRQRPSQFEVIGMDTSTYAPFLDYWTAMRLRAVIASYVRMTAFVILLYDSIITMADEVSEIRSFYSSSPTVHHCYRCD